MEGDKVIKVTFTDEIEIITSTEHLYQWDVGQVLEIDGLNVGTPMVHFGVKGDTTGYAVQSQLIDGKLRCGIPDSVLQSGKQIIAYVYVSAGASKYTEKVILIPVVERNKPNNYRTVNMDEVTETQSFFDSMVERLTSLEKRVPISFWAGTQAEYDKTEQKQNNCLYIVTDDYTVPIESEEHKGCFYRVVGNEVEWINPPMLHNVEYRTTERFSGRPVYVKLLAFQAAHAGESSFYDVVHSGQPQDVSIVSVNGSLYNHLYESEQPFPVCHGDKIAGTIEVYMFEDDELYFWQVRQNTYLEVIAEDVVNVIVKYTKD